MTASEWQEPTTNPPRSRAWGSEHAWEPALEPGLGEMALADGPGASAPQQRQRQTPGPRQHASQPVPGCTPGEVPGLGPLVGPTLDPEGSPRSLGRRVGTRLCSSLPDTHLPMARVPHTGADTVPEKPSSQEEPRKSQGERRWSPCPSRGGAGCAFLPRSKLC